MAGGLEVVEFGREPYRILVGSSAGVDVGESGYEPHHLFGGPPGKRETSCPGS